MVYFVILVGILIFGLWKFGRKKRTVVAAKGQKIDEHLLEQIQFYSLLNTDDQTRFREKIISFLNAVTITPVNTGITESDRIFIAAGAVIPIFRFPQWEYIHLQEILVYDSSFNFDFKSTGENRNIAGLVGTGVYEGKMMLSLSAIRESFLNKTDKRNTVIHEFVHLIDKTDGDTDGIPAILLDQQFTLPWLNLMHEEMQHILKDNSDIDNYGLTNKSEFFAVAAEYFFEQPEMLAEKHPALYALLGKMFLRN